MGGIKRFLDKRAEGKSHQNNKITDAELPKTKVVKTTTIDKDAGFIEYEQKIEDTEVENPNLTDDEFWDISNKFNKDVKNSDDPPAVILQKILENYTPLKINQFAKRYTELNS